MGNCFAKLRSKKEKNISEILSRSSAPRSSRPSSKLEKEMIEQLSVTEFENDASSTDSELANISETIEYTEVEEILIEKPGFSYVINLTEGKLKRMPSRLAERAASRLNARPIKYVAKLNEEDERLMDEILLEEEEKERKKKELKEKQKQAEELREAHLAAIREKARAMRNKAKHRTGHRDGGGGGDRALF